MIKVQEQILRDTLISAKHGDKLAREELIESHKPFIARVSSKFCNRYLSWDNDDELSIALLAFNEAIDNYDPQLGGVFHNFVQTVIRRRLVDYFRKEGKHQHLSLSPMNPEDKDLSKYDLDTSQAKYHEEEKQAELTHVVERFLEILGEYGIALDDLIKLSPKHRDSRENLMSVASTLSNQEQLLKQLQKQKMLPIKELELLTGTKRKVLEKNRKYIIALTLIFSEPEFYAIKSFIQF